MKKIILLVLPFFFLVGCKDDDIADYTPVVQPFECTFTNLRPKQNLKISFECLEYTQYPAYFYLASSTSTYKAKEGVILLPKEALTKAGEVFKCHIHLSPYPREFSSRGSTTEKLTYIMRIYKDEELLLEKKLVFPKKDYETIKIEL